jgi:hypothetical protein
VTKPTAPISPVKVIRRSPFFNKNLDAPSGSGSETNEQLTSDTCPFLTLLILITGIPVSRQELVEKANPEVTRATSPRVVSTQLSRIASGL